MTRTTAPYPTAPRRTLRPGLAAAALMAIGAAPIAAATAAAEPYALEVTDVSAKVGEHATMMATLHLQDGVRILEAYNNRMIQMSADDNGVVFGRKMVPAAIKDGTLVVAVDVQPTKPGRHPINAVFRFGYITDGDTMMMVSVPVIATVTGTE